MAQIDAVIYDLLVDCPIGSEDILIAAVDSLGGRVMRDPKDPDELYYCEADEDDDQDLGGWAQVRVKNTDPEAYARELTRRVWGLRVVGTYEMPTVEGLDARTA